MAVKTKPKVDSRKRAVTPRFSADLYQKIEQCAIEQRRSVANMLERIVEFYFEQGGDKR